MSGGATARPDLTMSGHGPVPISSTESQARAGRVAMGDGRSAAGHSESHGGTKGEGMAGKVRRRLAGWILICEGVISSGNLRRSRRWKGGVRSMKGDWTRAR